MSSSPTSSEVSKGLYPIQTSPTRPRPHTTRSITEVSPPSFPKLHRHHHHHRHPHLPHSSKEPQSAQPNLQLSISHTGEGSTSNDGSRDVSRQGSILLDEPKKQNVEVELEEEKMRTTLMASELRNSVMDLNTLSNNMTRRLDVTYYSVLEKLSALQNTIVSLKELASITKSINKEFESESNEVVKDVTNLLDTFGGFTEQEKRINSLKSRVAAGRERIKALGERVRVVKDRVEGWEKAEWEWQEKTRKRLNILWTLMGIVVITFIALKGLQYMPVQTPDSNLTEALNASGLEKIPDLEALRNDTWKLERKIQKSFDGLKNADIEEAFGEEDPRLRVFDEL